MTRRSQHLAAGALLLLLPGSCLVPAAPMVGGGTRGTASASSLAVASAPQFDAFALPRSPQQGLVMVAAAPLGAVAVTLDGAPIAVAADGRFLLGFDRDAPATAMLRAARSGLPPTDWPLRVAPGNWRIERINAPYRGGAANSVDFARRRPAELAQISAARQQQIVSDGWRQSFIWPVRGRLSGLFGAQRVYRGKPGTYHSGLDIAVPAGTPFVAPADGVVVLAASAPFTLEGNLLIVDHGMGLTSAFLHTARIDVIAGQRVRQGQPLGTVGATGRATGPHLHWGLRWHTARLDPLLLLPQ